MTDLTVSQTLAIGLPIAFFIIFLEAVFSACQKKRLLQNIRHALYSWSIGWKHDGSSSHKRINPSFPYLSVSVQTF